MNMTADAPLLAADGVPLAVKLKRAERRKKLRAALLVAPLAVFLLATFILPIALLLYRSVENPEVPAMLPKTVSALAGWQGQGLPDELQTIVDSANHLLARLSDALDTERALAANAAHELRTPLAAVRLNLQTALVHVPTGAAYTDIQGALQSLDRLSRRCEKLLQLSRAGSGAALAQDRVNLAQVAAAVAQEFWADAALLQRLQLVLPEDDDVWVRGDFDALAIALRNLVENAVRYAPQGPIVLEVALPATCSVRDSGPGLTTEQLGLLQQRHYREGHTASALYTPGYGLGLSIVTTIVARQGGTCTLHSPPPGHGTGLQVDLHLRADR